jgi:hypothetical protein
LYEGGAVNEIRVWSIVDANGEALWSHNVREEAEAELETRVATDPRLRRVLRIEERTLTFHRRDQPIEEPGEAQTVCVLPWLPLDEPVAMGPLLFDHWSEVRERVPDDARETADELLANFYDIYGYPIDPVVCFFSRRSPTDRLDDDERDFVRTQTFLLALAGLAENVYLHHAFEPMNAAHARRLFLNFEVGRPAMYPVRRRREGWAQGRWRSRGLRMTKPFAAAARPTAAGEDPLMTLYRRQFVDSLSRCVGADDHLSLAITQSVVPFLRANDMDEYGSVEQDIVWLVAALEQLIGRGRQVKVTARGFDLGVGIADLFVAQWAREGRTDCRRWMNDLNRKRNELHGQAAQTEAWQPWAHALLASEIYPLVVKALLAAEDRYILDSLDLAQIEAFPPRAVLVGGAGPFDEAALGEVWHQALANALSERVRGNAGTG